MLLDDEEYMRHCLSLAREAVMEGNHGVGALVVVIQGDDVDDDKASTSGDAPPTTTRDPTTASSSASSSTSTANGDQKVPATRAAVGDIVGEAGEENRAYSLTGHAEILAMNQACQRLQTKDLSRCALYTTVEPCWMCSFAIRESRVRRVVYGMPNLAVGGANSRHPLLGLQENSVLNKGWARPPEVMGGILIEECTRMRAMMG